jgi:5'-methylthioadenosine phosphorylase
VGHSLPPHRINYRANVEAMAQLGVRALLAPFAAGSLRPDVHPGDLVVVDQFVDQTSGRGDTFHENFDDGPQHVSVADPYDERLRTVLVEVGRGQGFAVHDGGTVVVINGPRFATRAESAWYRSAGWHVINMTQYPEVTLAAEAGIPFAGLALITDYDSGVESDPGIAPVTQEQVFAFFEQNVERLRDLLVTAIPQIAATLDS